MKKAVFLLAAILLMAGSTAVSASADSETASAPAAVTSSVSASERADMSGYKTLTDEKHNFIDRSMEEVLSLFSNKGSAVVYFGYTQCPYCNEAVPVLNDAAKATNSQIWYVPTRDKQKKMLITDSEKRRFVLQAKDYMKKDEETGSHEFFVPFVIAIKDGKVVDGCIGTVERKNADKNPLTAEQRELLQTTYQEIIQSSKTK